MTYQIIGSTGFLTDYVHVTFLVGLVISYLYFRRRQISVGGSLAVGYLASSLYMPLNVLSTLVAALLGYVLIKFVILKIFLPRPRQIFAIGLGVGVGCGAVWMALTSWLLGGLSLDGLSLVGVIVPGMLCNSLIKQGVVRTVVPLAWMVPAAGLAGLAITMLTSTLLPGSLANTIIDTNLRPVPMLFLMSALSVLFAVLVQEGTVRSRKLRTGGYVTAGVIVSVLTSPGYLVVLAAATLLVLGVYVPYSRKVPLFGKDRFVILCTVSFVMVTLVELVMASFTGVRFDGPTNVVFCVLPAIIANDLVQYGFKRTSAGMGLSIAGCAAVAVPVMVWG
ncbi:MAG: poly-gamma-glutamate biosynthesis protein PgsC/CapC [Corynebacterium sp.]|uniref:poly-gamma-glutamate biosynthesis protein PgsC/CapC n=1 Tax=unclassified Corynebacterium TaxID=2624378 RepID=UPI002647878C|nr:poly-gamma-glutamate biosynthesis protein PgsC/CapC [Corynebacterium sp.]MDN5718694.1 poly-gamma-glutamate biosynthesis protein PgsC/CapC [Corynebacterium sp.]MDN6323781.1 poly-gamma-glutamate biosynthesis protein PgsC/CapC [Corynebacterium sp.]MDN6509565.1 poly-gamma-glutamate biosynthesis protein PgsC/CapC [Corynebacterium sp.]